MRWAGWVACGFCMMLTAVVVGAPTTGPATAGAAVPYEHADALRFGPATCPTAIVRDEVWDVSTGKKLSTLEGATGRRELRAVSTDGKLVAAAIRDAKSDQSTIGIFSAETGAKAAQVTVGGSGECMFLGFAGRDLLTVAQDGGQKCLVEVWNSETGKQLRKFAVDRPNRQTIALSTDGKMLAVIGEKPAIYSTLGGQVMAVLRPPAKRPEKDAQGNVIPERPIPRRPGARDVKYELQVKFAYTWAQKVAFSHDGREVAILTTHPQPRVLCWDRTGALLSDIDAPIKKIISHGNPLEWVPDNSGWLLVGQFLMDRKAKAVVYANLVGWPYEPNAFFLDKNRLLTIDAATKSLKVVEVPWAKIRKSVDAMLAKAPAHLRPGEAMSLKFEFGQLRGGEDEPRQKFTEALKERMELDGVKLADNRPVGLTVKYSEKAGETVRIVEKNRPFDRGHDTGRTAVETLGVVELSLKVKDKTIWSQTIEARPASSYEGEINDNTVRSSTVQDAAWRLKDYVLPYFVPVDEKLAALPIVEGQ